MPVTGRVDITHQKKIHRYKHVFQCSSHPYKHYVDGSTGHSFPGHHRLERRPPIPPTQGRNHPLSGIQPLCLCLTVQPKRLSNWKIKYF